MSSLDTAYVFFSLAGLGLIYFNQQTQREKATLAGWVFLSACQFYLLFICPLIQSDLHYDTCLPWSGVTLTLGTMRFTPPMSDAQVIRLQKGGRQPTGTQSPPEQRG